jgi:poly(A) polymerase
MFSHSLNFIQKLRKTFFPFYKNKELKFIFKKLQDGTPEGKIVARFVGGCVRKYLSNERIDDIDVATTLTTDQIKEKFRDTNLKVIETGVKHGTVTIVSKNHKVEITTLRKDIKTDGRHAEVEYTEIGKKILREETLQSMQFIWILMENFSTHKWAQLILKIKI